MVGAQVASGTDDCGSGQSVSKAPGLLPSLFGRLGDGASSQNQQAVALRPTAIHAISRALLVDEGQLVAILMTHQCASVAGGLGLVYQRLQAAGQRHKSAGMVDLRLASGLFARR